MLKGNNFLAIIPARSGSKGLPGKNTKLLCGKPLLAWSIEAGKKSNYIDDVIVSTDSLEIAEIAKKHGALVPFLRPVELSTDTATTFDVLQHAINFAQMHLKKTYDYIVLLEPTSPLRTSRDVDSAIERLLDSEASAVVGVAKTECQNPAFLVIVDDKGYISGYENKDMRVLRRQEIKDVYFFEGSVYVSKTQVLLDKRTFYHSGTLGQVFPKWKSLEIDDMEDFVMVEALMNFKGGDYGL